MADGAPICSCEEYKREIARLRRINQSLQDIIDSKNGYPTSVYFCDMPLDKAVDVILEYQAKEKPLLRG